jgi:hypothetical protein
VTQRTERCAIRLLPVATSPDVTVLDGSGRNRPFTQVMLKYIRTPGFEIRSMLARVRRPHQGDQRAAGAAGSFSSLTGDFYFKPGS